MDVGVNGINPPYPAWRAEMPDLVRSVIAAVREAGATVLIPGNVYNYGAGMPATLNEHTPWHPTAHKGQLRVEMEEAFRRSGVRTIVLRSGDFFEAADSGDWFGHYITAQSHQGKTMYPGPLDQIHAWGYLPDMARAAVGLAQKRAAFADFEEFTFAGYGVTGQQLLDEIGRALGKAQRHKGMPWGILRLLGLFNPLMREVLEMRYLWNVPHQIDGTKLARALPGFQPTPFEKAIKDSLKAA
jgi:nucleoside-diphosphate-sugar epimerase